MRSRILLLALAAACAPALPREPVQRALVSDLARVVQSRDQILGWFYDENDIREVMPDTLDSVCRVAPEQRAAAMRWLDDKMAGYGGSAKEAWLLRGKDMDAIEEPLLYDRTRQLLRAGDELARQGKCPFWLEPQEEFVGRQNTDRKFLIDFETGGRFYSQWENGKGGVGGGGAARIMIGYGFGDKVTVVTGGEFGGAARFTDVKWGETLEVPGFLIITSMPTVIRFHNLSTYYELEVAPMSYTNQLRVDADGRVQPQYGIRVGGGIGVSRTMFSGFLPGITASINYDFIPARNGLPEVHQIGAGFRGVFYRGF